MTEKIPDYNTYLGKDLSVLIILSSLSPDEYLSTYDIIKRIKKQTKGKISFRAGTIYPQMSKLAEGANKNPPTNLLEKKAVETPSRSGATREKTVYKLTSRGVAKVQEQLTNWAALRKIIDGLVGLGNKEIHNNNER